MSKYSTIGVSAFFRSPELVEQVAKGLVQHGLPRDLIDITVSPIAAERYYSRRVRSSGTMVFPYAGGGALIGLLVGVLIALAVMAVPGYTRSWTFSVAQLLGPNVATLVGAIVGGLWGIFTPRHLGEPFRRVCERDEILLVITGVDSAQAVPVRDYLTRAGGEAAQLHFG
ncbi:MAG: hypothetical protein HY692_03465 [Cyanobacteria bacterium NC_groundwater_1444_Ag_S-0.65um_54_12]|nr:hypothetical protein [Cyanobacteria bacterium NC_groundwater_1444_Ag_S-0.65um_54_12]